MPTPATNPMIPPEIRCWEVGLDAVHWQDDALWWQSLDLRRFESLVQLRHRTLALLIDLDWFDPDGPEGHRGGPTPTGKFRLRVVQNLDWENPIDGFHITDASGLDAALRRLIKRHG